MARSVRKSWTARLAGFAVVFGLLVQCALGLPASLAMAQAAPVCSATHGSATGDTPGQPQHDHAHCLLCQTHAGPPLPPIAMAVWQAADLRSALAPLPEAASILVADAAAGFRSRAPPGLA